MLGSRNIRRNGHTSNAAGLRRPSLSAVMAGLALLTLMVLVALTGVKPASAAPAPVFANKAPDGAGLNDHARRPEVHPEADQDLRAPCGDADAGQPVRHARGHRPAPDPGAPDALGPAHGRRLLQQPLSRARRRFAAADQPFPRLTTPRFKAAEGVPAGFFGPGSPAVASSSYAQKKGDVFDSRPRTVSNLIVDQTSTNPAAVAAAGFPVRTQGNDGLVPCTTDPVLDADGTRADARLAHRERAGQPG